MRYAFRLAELLGHTPDRRRRPGTIKAIVEHTGLDRHQVASLLKNEAKYIPVEALSRICDYLIDNGFATADQLPGALFAVRAENFWELLARRRKLEIFVGVRRGDTAAETPDSAWVVASDMVLMGELLNGVSTLGGTAKHYQKRPGQTETASGDKPQPSRLLQTLVWSPGHVDEATVRSRATETYSEFADASGDKAMICIGSIKSNPVVDMVLTDTFGGNPFESQDDVASPQERRCPFFLRYRDHDPKPPSVSAGMRLAKDTPADKPGIYYEQADGTWTWAGGDRQSDTALVFYVFREPLGRLDMIFSGFSGRATRLLARYMAVSGEEFWPPVYEEPSVQVGAFIVQFESEVEDVAGAGGLLETSQLTGARVIRLPAESIRRRLLPT
jgi:hypothetical protein